MEEEIKLEVSFVMYNEVIDTKMIELEKSCKGHLNHYDNIFNTEKFINNTNLFLTVSGFGEFEIMVPADSVWLERFFSTLVMGLLLCPHTP